MDHLTRYYINQGGEGLQDLIGPVYQGSPFIQSGHGIGSFLGSLFKIIKPVLISGVKKVGKQSLLTGANILSDIALKDPKTKIKHIIKKRVAESVHQKGYGKKRKRDIFS